jgi:hypothetical protein
VIVLFAMVALPSGLPLTLLPKMPPPSSLAVLPLIVLFWMSAWAPSWIPIPPPWSASFPLTVLRRSVSSGVTVPWSTSMPPPMKVPASWVFPSTVLSVSVSVPFAAGPPLVCTPPS